MKTQKEKVESVFSFEIHTIKSMCEKWSVVFDYEVTEKYENPAIKFRFKGVARYRALEVTTEFPQRRILDKARKQVDMLITDEIQNAFGNTRFQEFNEREERFIDKISKGVRPSISGEENESQ